MPSATRRRARPPGGGRARLLHRLTASLASRGALLAVLSAGIALDSVAIVLASACLASMCARVFYPAVAASLPALARSREELVAANAAVSSIEHVGSVIGPALAGVALIAVSPAAVCMTAAIGTLGAALVVAGPLVSRAEQGEPPWGTGPPSRRRELSAGFSSLFGPVSTRRLVGIHAIHCVAIGALGVAVLHLALEELRVGTAGVGLLEGALAVGGITGGVVAMARARTHSSDQSVLLGSFLWAVPFIAVVALLEPIVAVVALAVAGVATC